MAKLAGDEPVQVIKKGPKRPYITTEIDEKSVKETELVQNDYLFIFIASAISMGLKLYSISDPSLVVYEEVTTLKHINSYIHGVYFNGVAPPLADLIYTFIAYILGYRGDDEVPDATVAVHAVTSFPFVALRAVTVLFSTAHVAVAYLTLRSCTVKPVVALVACLLLAMENLFILDSRLIMPDTLFLLGLSLTVLSAKRLTNSEPFSRLWFKNLILTGLAMGLSASTKWIGFATIAYVLALALLKVWLILGDVEVSNCKVTKHVTSRALAFLVIPALVYFLTSVVHIELLTQFNRDAALLPSHYQRDLIGNGISDIPKYVTYGSRVTIRHKESLGGYLHSHKYNLRTGSKNQQVTVYDYQEFNNEWIVVPFRQPPANDPRVKRDASVFLRHAATGAMLRVDPKLKPPVSEQDYNREVSCFGNSTYQGNETETLKLKWDQANGQYLTAVDTEFTIVNPKKSCTILSHDLKLPSWGYNQQEVLCIESPNAERAKFIVESVKYPADFNTSILNELDEKLEYRPLSIFGKFLVLTRIAVRLIQRIEVPNDFLGVAKKWPMLLTGAALVSTSDITVLALGNPVTFYLSLVLILVALAISLISVVRGDCTRSLLNYRANALGFVAGWAFHFLPYVYFEGNYHLTDYAPALYFGVLLIGVTLQYSLDKNRNFGTALMIITLVSMYYMFLKVMSVVYGTTLKHT